MTVAAPSGFEYRVRGKDVVITHHGRVATALRGGGPLNSCTPWRRVTLRS